MKVISLKSIVLTISLILVAASHALADVKIKTRTTMQMDSASGAGRNNTSESTTYIKGARQRTESVGSNPSILQCDLKRYVNIDDAARTYSVMLMGATAGAAGERTQPAAPASTATPRRGGVITMTTVTTDLKETKRFPQFGNIVARHYRTETVMESSPEACNQMNMRIVKDGWYADIQADLACDFAALAASRPSPMARPDCQDRYETKNTGAVVRGYPLYETSTTSMTINMMGRSMTNNYTTTSEVLEFSNAPLSAALFNVPAGYTEQKEGVVGGSSSGSDDADDDDASSSGAATGSGMGASGSRPGSGAGMNQPATGGASASAALGAKREGVVRIGVPMPTAKAGEGIDSQTLAAAVRNSLADALRTPSVEVAPLEARQPALIEAEAREKQCDYILFTNVTHKKGGGGGLGGFLRKAAPVADVISMGGASSTVAGAATTAAVYTAAGIATSIKAKDEITLDYRLTTAANTSTPVATRSFKGKAKSDGDDVLTPLVQQEATAVLAEATKK